MADEKKGIVQEFKEFISRGNVMDLAVAVIIGGAFTNIVTALTDNVVNPLITLLTGGGIETSSALVIQVTEDVAFDFSTFISAIINFLLVALVVFFIVKAMNKANEAAAKAKEAVAGKEEEEAAPEEVPPTCPYCKTEVPEGATRCPHCTSEFDEPAHKTIKE